MPDGVLRRVATVLIALGLLLDFYAMMFKSSQGATAFTLFLMVWLWCPYLVCAWIARKGRFLLGVSLSVTMIFALDVADYVSIFVRPKHSTAALALFFAPLWNLFVLIPVGLTVGWLVERITRSRNVAIVSK